MLIGYPNTVYRQQSLLIYVLCPKTMKGLKWKNSVGDFISDDEESSLLLGGTRALSGCLRFFWVGVVFDPRCLPSFHCHSECLVAGKPLPIEHCPKWISIHYGLRMGAVNSHFHYCHSSLRNDRNVPSPLTGISPRPPNRFDFFLPHFYFREGQLNRCVVRGILCRMQ